MRVETRCLAPGRGHQNHGENVGEERKKKKDLGSLLPPIPLGSVLYRASPENGDFACSNL